MTEPELNKLIKLHRIRGKKNIAGLRLIYIAGMKMADAARHEGMSGMAALWRAAKLIERTNCPICGKAIK